MYPVSIAAFLLVSLHTVSKYGGLHNILLQCTLGANGQNFVGQCHEGEDLMSKFMFSNVCIRCLILPGCALFILVSIMHVVKIIDAKKGGH